MGNHSCQERERPACISQKCSGKWTRYFHRESRAKHFCFRSIRRHSEKLRNAPLPERARISGTRGFLVILCPAIRLSLFNWRCKRWNLRNITTYTRRCQGLFFIITGSQKVIKKNAYFNSRMSIMQYMALEFFFGFF